MASQTPEANGGIKSTNFRDMFETLQVFILCWAIRQFRLGFSVLGPLYSLSLSRMHIFWIMNWREAICRMMIETRSLVLK